MKIKNIFFDLDGTLIDSSEDIAKAINKMLDFYKLERIFSNEVTNIIGKGYPTTVRKVLSKYNIATDKIDSMVEKGVKIVSKEYKRLDSKHTKIYDNVITTLDKLSQKNINMAVVTNKEIDAARIVIKTLGISKYFKTIVGGNTTAEYKPSAEPLLYAMKKLDAKNTDSLMIGDSINDYMCAKNANTPCILLSYGYNHGLDITSLDSLATLDKFEDILKFI